MRLAMEGYWQAHQTKAVKEAVAEFRELGCMPANTYMTLTNLGVDPAEVIDLMEDEDNE